MRSLRVILAGGDPRNRETGDGPTDSAGGGAGAGTSSAASGEGESAALYSNLLTVGLPKEALARPNIQAQGERRVQARQTARMLMHIFRDFREHQSRPTRNVSQTLRVASARQATKLRKIVDDLKTKR